MRTIKQVWKLTDFKLNAKDMLLRNTCCVSNLFLSTNMGFTNFPKGFEQADCMYQAIGELFLRRFFYKNGFSIQKK